jgi:hypothetical protein
MLISKVVLQADQATMKRILLALGLLCVWAHQAFGQGSSPSGVLDSLKDAKGRLIAYTDGYKVFDARGQLSELMTGSSSTLGLPSRTSLVSFGQGPAYAIQSVFKSGNWEPSAVSLIDGKTGESIGNALNPEAAAEQWGILIGGEEVMLRKGQELLSRQFIVDKSAVQSKLKSEVQSRRLPSSLKDAKLQVAENGKELLAKLPTGEVTAAKLTEISSAAKWKPASAEVWRDRLRDQAKSLLLPMPPLPAVAGSLKGVLGSRTLPKVSSRQVHSDSTAPSLSHSNAPSLISSTGSTTSPGESTASGSTSSQSRSVVKPSLRLSSDQLRASTWYFGHGAGLRFSELGVESISGGKLDQLEGCATLSDVNGTALAYSDGLTVFTPRHREVEGGKGLSSDASSTQGALFVPVPGREDQVLLFTVDQGGYRGQSKGLRASRLDVSAGAEAAKIERLSRDIELEARTTEKLAAVHHADGERVWVLAHRAYSREFIAYLVTAEGLAAKPVVSEAGSFHNGLGNGSIGQMKFSPDGHFLAVAITGSNTVEAFAFDNATGRVGVRLFSSTPRDSISISEPYGVEFSVSGLHMFVTSWRRNAVARIDFTSRDSLQIARSIEWQEGAQRSIVTGALQLGPDGNIYIALATGPGGRGHTYVGQITQPDGRWRYVENGVKLAEGTRSGYGLPSVVASLLSKPKVRFEVGNACEGSEESFRNTTRPKDAFAKWSWTVGGAFVSTKESLTHRFDKPGSYVVKLVGTLSDGTRDSLTKQVAVSTQPKIELGPNTTLPPDGTALRIGPEVSDSTVLYVWSNGATKSHIEVNLPGSYTLTARSGNCVVRDTIRVFPRPISVALASSPSGEPTQGAEVGDSGNQNIPPSERSISSAKSNPELSLAEALSPKSLLRALAPFEPYLSLTVQPAVWTPGLQSTLSEAVFGPIRWVEQPARATIVGGLRYRLK